MKTKLFAAAMLGLAALSFNTAMAHGEAKARHGGVVAMASDLGFELVGTASGAAIYIDDHGKPMAPAGMSGKLTVLQGTAKTEAALAVAGDKLEAAGLKLAPGARAVAVLTTAAGKVITVRFSVK